MTTQELDTIMFCAMRYALEHLNYTAPSVTAIISNNSDKLLPATRALMIRDIGKFLSKIAANDSVEDYDHWELLLCKLEIQQGR